MKKPSKDSILGFASQPRPGHDRRDASQPSPTRANSFSLTAKQTELYGKITEENGFSMEASLKRLEQSQAGKASPQKKTAN